MLIFDSLNFNLWITVFPDSFKIPWLFPDFLIFFQNSLTFPWLEKVVSFFQVFQDFQCRWEPCLMIHLCSLLTLFRMHYRQKRLQFCRHFSQWPTNGAFTLHGTGSGTGTGNNGLLYIMQNCSHCTGTGTGKLANGFCMHFPIFPHLKCILVMHFNGPGPCAMWTVLPGPGSVQCECAVSPL